MTRAEKRRLRRLMNPDVPSNIGALRAMTDGSLMTVPRAVEFLGVGLQTARNCLCKLVHTKHAVIVTAKAPGRPATYRITETGRHFIADFERAAQPKTEAETEQAVEEAERALARERAVANVIRARTMVPNSVFALGRLVCVHGEGVAA
ncbi:hypothetical protein VLK31_34835 [Variovorax sp. H27-G14]|uniref:hypothetical protein n=1 Tax=Variovorax sp. H27-G14 TaxID=3111914 RepID=UPI0038FC1442